MKWTVPIASPRQIIESEFWVQNLSVTSDRSDSAGRARKIPRPLEPGSYRTFLRFQQGSVVFLAADSQTLVFSTVGTQPKFPNTHLVGRLQFLSGASHLVLAFGSGLATQDLGKSLFTT